jgi:hypothetical protein
VGLGVGRWPLDTAEKIIAHFDFTICAAAVWWDDLNRIWKSQVHQDFYADLDRQRLVYTGSEEPGGSLLRAFKYSRRGYHIFADSIAEIVEGLLEQRYRDNSGPVDILTLLREVDPLPDSPEKASTIILTEEEIPF